MPTVRIGCITLKTMLIVSGSRQVTEFGKIRMKILLTLGMLQHSLLSVQQ